MIVESLIQDDSKLTLAKATLSKGSKVEIEDALYWGPEVQGALKLGMIRVVGKVPDPIPVSAGTPEERKIRYKNVYQTKLCFDCIKNYVAPGEYIEIPESKLYDREIQNAIAWEMIVSADGSSPSAVTPRQSVPVEIDEFRSKDAVDELSELVKKMDEMPSKPKQLSPEEQKIAKSRTSKKSSNSDFKPKAISSGVDSEGSELYSETKVVDPTPKTKKVAAPPAPVQEEPEQPVMPRKAKSFGFMDVFGGAQVSKPKDDAEGF